MQSLRQRLLGASLILLVLGLAAFTVDIPLARLLASQPLNKELVRIFNFAEIGAHGTGAAMLLVAALASSGLSWSRQRDRLLAARLIAASYSGGLLVNVIKALVVRIRPKAAQLDLAQQAFATFGNHLLSPGEHSRAALMSFPSGHAAVAAGLAAALTWFFPKGKPAFIGLAVLAILQRPVSEAHYLSDVCIGAALGLLGAWIWLPQSQPPGAESL